MKSKNLQQVIDTLINKYGHQGACEYISTGEYPYELKSMAMELIKQKQSKPDNLVTNSEYTDVENPWGSSFETFYYAS